MDSQQFRARSQLVAHQHIGRHTGNHDSIAEAALTLSSVDSPRETAALHVVAAHLPWLLIRAEAEVAEGRGHPAIAPKLEPRAQARAQAQAPQTMALSHGAIPTSRGEAALEEAFLSPVVGCAVEVGVSVLQAC